MQSVVASAQGITSERRKTGGLHSYSMEETSAFTEVINSYLGHDASLSERLPIDASSSAVFEACADGVLLCKLIALVDSNAVDDRAVNVVKLSKFKIIENNNLAINAAVDVGCRITNIGAQDIIDATPHLVLGLLWQIIRLLLTREVSLKQHPELVRLVQGDETFADLLALPPETILVRWVNYHLRNAESDVQISKLGKELSDSKVYSILMTQLYGVKLQQAVDLEEPKLEERAASVLANAVGVGIRPFIKPRDIVSGNAKLNLAFVAELFNDCPGFDPLDEQEKRGLTDLDELDQADSREARTFKTWVNSLNLVDAKEQGGDGEISAPVTDFYSDLSESNVILRVMDAIEPGIVNWKMVTRSAKGNKIKKVANGNLVIDIAKKMSLSVVNIGGADLAASNKKLVLAIMWQLMRRNTVDFLGKLKGDGGSMEEKELVAWANDTVGKGTANRGAPSVSIKGLSDKTLKTGRFFLELCEALSAESTVNWEIVTPGLTDEDALLNARYALSVARRMGACCFCSPEDVVQVKPKMMMLFLASLWPFGLEGPKNSTRPSLTKIKKLPDAPSSQEAAPARAAPPPPAPSKEAAPARAAPPPPPITTSKPASPPKPPPPPPKPSSPKPAPPTSPKPSSFKLSPPTSPKPAPPTSPKPSSPKPPPPTSPKPSSFKLDKAPSSPPKPPPPTSPKPSPQHAVFSSPRKPLPPRKPSPKKAPAPKLPELPVNVIDDEETVDVRSSQREYEYHAKGGTGEPTFVDGDEVDDDEW